MEIAVHVLLHKFHLRISRIFFISVSIYFAFVLFFINSYMLFNITHLNTKLDFIPFKISIDFTSSSASFIFKHSFFSVQNFILNSYHPLPSMKSFNFKLYSLLLQISFILVGINVNPMIINTKSHIHKLQNHTENFRITEK